jgi:phage anti-repressor protein
MKEELAIYEGFARIAESPEPYPVDFDDAWQWVGYSRKDHALRALRDNFEEGVDYHLPNNGEVVKREQGGGTQPAKYFLTTDCFKAFCMMAGTEKGKEVRQYYLAIEKKYREVQRRFLGPDGIKAMINQILDSRIGMEGRQFSNFGRITEDAGLLRFGMAELVITGVREDRIDVNTAYRLYLRYTDDPLPLEQFENDLPYTFTEVNLDKRRGQNLFTGCRVSKVKQGGKF